tara:strand:- start:1014 stop:2537 length:1524 start_codon:yes stop_codon:yes gene_type:complete
MIIILDYLANFLNIEIILLIFFFFHLLTVSYDLRRYLFSLDEISRIHKLLIITSLLTIPLGFYFYQKSNNLSIPLFLVLFSILRHIHIDRRYKSLSRGAGAVGIVPLQVLFFFILYKISFLYQLLIPSTILYLFLFSQGLMMLEAGICKYIFGYSSQKQFGLKPALLNPCWSRHYFLFKRLKNPYFCFINSTAVILQILCGILLLIPNIYLQSIGLVIYFIIFGFMFIFIDLASLSILTLLIPLISIFLLFSISFNESSYLNNNICLSIIFIYFVYFLSQKFSIYLDLLNKESININWIKQLLFYKKNIKSFPFLNRTANINKYIRNFIPIFPWRVFTPDITDTYMNIRVYSDLEKKIYKNYSWQERPKLLKIIPLFSIFYKEKLWKILAFASESIIQTTICNGFKNNKERSKKHSIRYINSIIKFLPKKSVYIELDIFQYDPVDFKSNYNSWKKRLTISTNLYLSKKVNSEIKFKKVSNVNIEKYSRFKSKSLSFKSSYFSKLTEN